MNVLKTSLVAFVTAFGCNWSTHRGTSPAAGSSAANTDDEAVLLTMSKNELARLQGALMYTGADFSAIMTWLNSQGTPCSLHSVLSDPNLGGSEDKRVEALGRTIAEYTVQVKFSPRHVPLPGDSRIVREALASLNNNSNERRNVIINALTAAIVNNINAKFKEEAAKQHGGLTAEQKTGVLLDLFFPVQSLRENYANWCPEDRDPVSRHDKIDSPLPDFVVPLTVEQLTQIVRGERLPAQRRNDDPGLRRYDQSQPFYPRNPGYQAPYLPGAPVTPVYPRRAVPAGTEPGGVGL